MVNDDFEASFSHVDYTRFQAVAVRQAFKQFGQTVDISNQYMQIIKDAVVHAPGDAVISANGEPAFHPNDN